MNVQITIIVKNNRLAIKKIARRLRILIHVLRPPPRAAYRPEGGVLRWKF